MLALLMALLSLPQDATAADYTPVDQEISDEEVLRLVDVAYPGLEQFAAAMEANDLPRAHELLVEHFATREQPAVPEPEFPGVDESNSMIVLQGSKASQATADAQWMKHIFTLSNNDAGKMETFDLGPNIKWTQNPSKALSWILYLNQLNVVSGLAGLYRDVSEEKYAEEAGRLVASWVKQVHRGYGYTRDGELINSGMEVRNRLCNCIAAYEVLRKSPSTTPEMHMAFWKVFITCARELIEYDGVSYPGLIPVAVMFPEFTEAPTWLEAGKIDLHKHLVGRTTPEGAWDTHSISYQTVPVPWAARSLEFLRANAGSGDYADTAAMIERQTTKLLELMLRITMPNLGLPNIGDIYGRSDWGSGHLLNILKSYLHVRMTPEQQEHLKGIEDPFERIKATLAVADGVEGDEPAQASMAFPGTGYYIMRSGWEPLSARYLYFDLSPQAMGHAHNDAGHFELYGYGKPLLTDTADYFLGWGYRAALHNTVEVDGQDQARGAAALMMPQEWISTEVCDFVDGAHTAYAHLGVSHRRKMILIKPDYAVVCDLLEGEASHKYEQFFHFAGPAQQEGARAQIDPVTLAAGSVHEDAANVRVIPTSTEGLSAELVEAQDTDMDIKDKFERKAMLGWIVTGGSFQRVKSAVAAYTREGPGAQTFHDVLFPIPRYGDADVQVEMLPVSEGGTTVEPSEAAGLAVHCEVKELEVEPEQIKVNLGPNLAEGKPASAEINETGFPPGAEQLVTNGETGPRLIGASIASSPYTPGVHLKGRFSVDFGEPVSINTVVLHNGTWNGSSIIYSPEQLSVQYWDGEQWRDVANSKTTWGAEFVSTTSFDTVRTSRISAAVERPSGGRLALREFQAFEVSAEELARVEELRNRRVARRWTDYILISHGPARMRDYGDIRFDGELAVLRESDTGQMRELMIKRGRTLAKGAQTVVDSPALVDALCAKWDGGEAKLTGLAPAGLRLQANGARSLQLDGRDMPATEVNGMLCLPVTPEGAAPVIRGVSLQLQPAQKDLGGGQPWATVTWQTTVPCTSQVEFSSEDETSRRTILDTSLTTEHSVRVDFLRPDRTYDFACVSVDRWGHRVEAACDG